jgi:hypothetical protein
MSLKIFCIFFLLLAGTSLFSQTELNEIRKVNEGLYFMYFDSSASKSTIVEFSDYLVMIEVPIIDKGGGATQLVDDIAGGEKVLRTLKNYFPVKPLKYILHSHWHMHSISSITPFIKNDVTIVSTKMNFDVLSKFMDSSAVQFTIQNFIFVEGDSLVISDENNRIVAYRFEQKDYPSTPTKDYLYFYIPKHNCIHAACMYTKWMGEPVDGKPVLSGREENLYAFINSKNINPEFIIRLPNEKSEANDMQTFAGLSDVNQTGIRSSDIMKKYLSLDALNLKENRDEIVKEALLKKIPASIFNSCVYAELRKKELERALNYAIIQSLVNPSDANSWDTLGEVYYFMGEEEVARSYLKQKQKMFPNHSDGGEDVWKKDLESYKIMWEKLK